MVSKSCLKKIKSYLSNELSKSYEANTPGITDFEPNENIRIEEKGHLGDVTRQVHYATGDFSDFVGYISFFKKRELPYAVSIANGEGIAFYKRASVAASKFSSGCIEKIEEIILDQAHRPKEKSSPPMHPEYLNDLY